MQGRSMNRWTVYVKSALPDHLLLQKAEALLLRWVHTARDAYDILLSFNRGVTWSGHLEKHPEDVPAGDFNSKRI
jgi:hypothetical protein